MTMFVDFDAVFNPNKNNELLNTKLMNNCPCKNCDENRLAVNNPYYISDKCDICKDVEIWKFKCLQKLSLLETPKKVTLSVDAYVDGDIYYDTASCPTCDCVFEDETDFGFNHCHNCGQALDWSDCNAED